MHAWEQIQRTVDELEAHLNEPVDIEALARLASLSPFYYQRLFKRLVKKPVAEYARLRRLAKAAPLLRDRDRRILDVALETGFSSHEHFTRAFKSAFGITPNAYRRHPVALNYMTKPDLRLAHALADENEPMIADGMVLEITRRELDAPVRFVGLEGSFPVQLLQGLGTESGADPLDALWRDFHSQKTAALGLAADGEELGATLPSPEEGQFCYFAGGRSPGGAVPDGYAAWELPRGRYVVCAFEAESFEALVMDALYKAEQYLYGVWLPSRGLTTDPFCAERYKSHGPGATAMEVWLRLC